MDSTFSKCLPTKNYASLVVLYSTRKNLRGGSTSPIHKNCQWSCVCDLRVIISKGPSETISYARVSNLNGGTGLYKQSDKLIRFSQTTTTIISKINDDTIDALFDEGPDHYIPGSKMPMQRITGADDRADLIAYLRRATDPETQQ